MVCATIIGGSRSCKLLPRGRVTRVFLYLISFYVGILLGAYLLLQSNANPFGLQTTIFHTFSVKNNNVGYTESLRNRRRCPTPLKLMFVILSSAYDVPRREAIRRTWLLLYKGLADVTIVANFVIGIKGVSSDLLHRLKIEKEQFRDVLYLDNVMDTFDNLTSKLLGSLVWAASMDFDYLIKCDSDSFVQIDRLVQALQKINCPSLLYWGFFNGMGYPDMTGKWSEKQWFLCSHFIPYAVGGGYVLSFEVVKTIVLMKEKLALYKNEDVSLGLWLVPFNVQRFHDIRFNTEGHSHGCNNNYIVSHKEKVATFIQKKKNLMSNVKTLCKIQREINPAYLYNWNMSPPLCCKRLAGIPVPR